MSHPLQLKSVTYKGDLVALVNDARQSVLPFDVSSCEIAEVTRTMEEEDTNTRPTCVQHAWAIQIKADVSLDPASTGPHWLYFSNPSCDSAADYSAVFRSDAEGLSDLRQRLTDQPPDLLTNGGRTWRLHLMSQPDAASAVAATPKNLSAAVAPPSAPIVVRNERVMLADRVEEVLHMIGLFLHDVFALGVAAQQTVVVWPPQLTFPVNVHAGDDAVRRSEHEALALPRLALLHTPQRASEWKSADDLRRPSMPQGTVRSGGLHWEKHLVRNPFEALTKGPTPMTGAATHVISGSCDYYHYRMDGFSDDGWGCAYRSLQTILSWFQYEGLMTAPMPSLKEIQKILFTVDPDKQSKKSFVGSRDWIGSFEIMLVLQHYITGLDCTIRRMESGAELDTSTSVQALLWEHFTHPQAPPVMIGGSSYAHTIAGVYMNPDTMEAQYLVLDPHYSANTTNMKTAINKRFVEWKHAGQFFESGSWYNLCVPRMDLYDPR